LASFVQVIEDSHVLALQIVDGYFGSPSGREKPSNTNRKELANG